MYHVGMNQQRAAEDAHRFLRSHTTGDVRFDGQFRPLKYVIGPDGRPVAPVTAAVLKCLDTVLFVPDDSEGAMQVQVTLSALDSGGPGGALTDRWRIYHGEPRDRHDTCWTVMEIDAARFGRCVIDGHELVRANQFAAEEARLCRQINGHHADSLQRACLHAAGFDVENPVLVGVDPLGFDVRRRFDVIRLPAPQPMTAPADVPGVLCVMGDG